MKVETTLLIASLRSELCPACGKKKKSRQTLCLACYRALPRDMQRALYDLLGEGYERAFSDAMTYLEVESPAFPSLKLLPITHAAPTVPALSFSKPRSFRAPNITIPPASVS